MTARSFGGFNTYLRYQTGHLALTATQSVRRKRCAPCSKNPCIVLDVAGWQSSKYSFDSHVANQLRVELARIVIAVVALLTLQRLGQQRLFREQAP